MGALIPPAVLHSLPPHAVATLTGQTSFPGLMSAPFKQGLVYAFRFSAALYLLAALASWRGGARVAQEADDEAAQPVTIPSRPAASLAD